VVGSDLTRAIPIEPRYRISDYGTIRTIAESPLRAGLLGVGTDDGLIQLSRDGGQTWTKSDRFPGVPERAQVTKLILSAHDEGAVYAAMSAHEEDDFRPFVLASADFGTTWTSLTGNLPERGQVRALAEHPRTADLLFAGTESMVRELSSLADEVELVVLDLRRTDQVSEVAVRMLEMSRQSMSGAGRESTTVGAGWPRSRSGT